MSDIRIWHEVRIEEGAVRNATLKAAQQLGWTSATSPGQYGPVVCVGRASKLPGVDLLGSSRSAIGVLALVEDDKDVEALADLDELARGARVALLRAPWSEARPARIREWLEELADSLRPERIRFARFASGTLFVTFGDGLSHAFDWRKTSALSKLRTVDPGTARASEDSDAVVVSDGKAAEIDIDGLVLRRIVDNQVAAESGAEFNAARARFGARLRSLREAAKISQVELSRRAGLSQEAISRLETGSREPRLETLKRLAQGLGVALPSLLRRIEARARRDL